MEQSNVKKDDGFFDVFPGLQELLERNAPIREKREWAMRQLEEIDRRRQNIQPKQGLTETERKAYIELKTFEYELHICMAIILIISYDVSASNEPELTMSAIDNKFISLPISSHLKNIFMERGGLMFSAMKHNTPVIDIVKEKASHMGVQIIELPIDDQKN